MGTKNCPEAPRQKMISVMYLVLTAMLALNVDKSVLEAFVMVDHSFTQTIENFNSKNQRVYSDFDAAAKENPAKAGELNQKVRKVKVSSDSLYTYINQLKEAIVKRADGPEGKLDDIQAKDNLNFAAEYMLTLKHGKELKLAIENYRNSLLSLVDTSNTELIQSIKKTLDTSPPKPKEGNRPSWEEGQFQGYPLIAVITLMSKMQSDVRNAEADVINHLYAQIDASSFKFNKLQAQVVSKSDYVLQGNTYEAHVFLSAVDTTAKPEIYVGGSQLPINSADNSGLYKVQASGEGKREWSGQIKYKNPEGLIVSYPFKHEYEVARPSMTVSPTKMNVFYAGLDNPVSISVPGISATNTKVSISNGSISPAADGTFIVRPDKVGVNSIITVNAMVDGSLKQIGTMSFRVKRVPDPIASVGGKSEGIMSKNELLAQQGVVAKIPEFDFAMNFIVQSFTVSTTRGGFLVEKANKGNRFSADQIDLIKGLNPGNRVYFENIVAKGEDGTVRNLNPVSFKIN